MRKYRDIEIFNRSCPKESKIDVNEIVIDKIVKYSDQSTIINDKRGENLFQARRFIIVNFIVVTINILIVTSLNLLK